MSERSQFHHLYSGRPPFQSMGRPENLINCIMISRIILNYKDITLQLLNLHFGLAKKVLKKLFIVYVKIIAHILILFSKGRLI